MQERVKEYMTDTLQGDKRLCDAMIPDFPLGCRRLTPGVGYLEALKAPNVTVVTDPITRVVPQGLETSTGELIKVDAIVCATGFNVSFCPRFPILGRKGNLQDKWTREVPKSYMSCAVPGFPNYFSKFCLLIPPRSDFVAVLTDISSSVPWTQCADRAW